jgi:hypothetical protein
MVKAGGVHLYNFTHRVYVTARSSLGQSGEGNIWAQGGHSGFRMQDVLAWVRGTRRFFCTASIILSLIALRAGIACRMHTILQRGRVTGLYTIAYRHIHVMIEWLSLATMQTVQTYRITLLSYGIMSSAIVGEGVLA